MMNSTELEKLALQIRISTVDAIASKGGGHIGGSLDIAELLAVLYGNVMRVRPEDPNWTERDYLVCSKGHAGPAVYSALAWKGFFPKDDLLTLNQNGTKLPGHCDRIKVPGIDATTGSLGQGLSIACGLSLGTKLKGSDQRVFCIFGDGELAEGQNWEAALFAAHYKLGNLTAYLDWNKKQIDGWNDEVMSLGDIQAKFQAFGWDVQQVKGTDISAIEEATRRTGENGDIPSLIILDTVKGAGVHCIEEIQYNHCIGMPPQLVDQAKKELAERAIELGMEVAE